MSERNIIIDKSLLSDYAFNIDTNSQPVFELLVHLGIFFDASTIVIASKKELE